MEGKQVEFLKALVELLLQQVDEGIHVTDERGYTLFYNSSAARIDGLSQHEAVGKHVLELFPSLDNETSTILQALSGGNPVQKLQQYISNLHGAAVLLESTTIPLKSGQRILGAVDISRDLTQVKALTDQVAELHSRFTKPGGKLQREHAYYMLGDLIGDTPELLEVKRKALRAAKTNSPILVTGETGTGKELLVHAIHNASSRKSKPFIAQNCAAIPAPLMEGILFGTVKGSFTGAESRPGLVEHADGGTLLLDEITCLDLDLQAKLLRFIQDGFVRRLGDTKLRKVDVRIIASTNIEPKEAVEHKLLRPDLFYRLNVVGIALPPLRQRRGDILPLARHFMEQLNHALGLRVLGWSKEVERALLTYSWPGNVRELRASLEGAMNMADTQWLQMGDFPEGYFTCKKTEVNSSSALDDLNLPEALANLEERFVTEAMERCKGNISQAAKLLGIPRQTLQYKLSKGK